MATVQALIIDPALRKVGQSKPETVDRNNALDALNTMLNSWSAQRLLIFAVTRENFPLVVNQQSYTIGSGGNFNTVRPTKIIDAYIRDAGSDFPLTIHNLKNFNDISVKATDGRPEEIHYLREFPLGVILFDLEPDKAYTVFLDSLKPLSTFASINTQVSISPEYEEALIYNLVLRISSEHDAAIPAEVAAIARDSLAAIRRINAQPAEELLFEDLPIRTPRFSIEAGGPI